MNSRAQRDLELVNCALAGDQSAYATLMQAYRDNIYYLMMKMIKNPDDADDLTIEAFGKAFKRLASFNPEYAFSTWLFRIASNNAIDFMRKRKKSATLSLDANFDDEESSGSFDIKSGELNPEQELMKTQRIDQMRQFVSLLKPKYKVLVELRYLKEYSYEEIAEHLQLPLGTVKAQLFRARELLYEYMKHSAKNI